MTARISAQHRHPKGLFNHAAAGQHLPPVALTIDQRAIRDFRAVLGLDDGETAPPTFFTFLDAQADLVRQQSGQPTILEHIGCDYRYLLHGEEEYTGLSEMRGGDNIIVHSQIGEFYFSSNQQLEFAQIQHSARSPAGQALIQARRLYIHRLPQ